MSSRNEDIREKLDVISQQIVAIYGLLDDATPRLPAQKEELLHKRVCLLCEKKIAASERVYRGCHQKCYRKTYRRIEAGDLSEDEAIIAGFVAPKKPSGPGYAENALTEYLQKREAAVIRQRAQDSPVSDDAE